MKLFVAFAALVAVSVAGPVGRPHPEDLPYPDIGLPNPFANDEGPLVQVIINVNQANKPIGPLPDKPLPPFERPPPACPGYPVAPDQPAVDPVIVVDDVPVPVEPVDVVVPVLPVPAVNDPEALN
ncbi:uncharacterized protein LOC142979910 [Anticarsia gemmatalis]|uniref:uncharacterized protein LOC142979910 n=1 Tax=Anticarsia gemmatalis TaxID=129554 RepID=UPI003F762EBB